MLRSTLFLAVLAASLQVEAQDAPAPLGKEELTGAAIGQTISMPMPSELFSALNKVGKPDWSALMRKPPASNFTNRQQIALNLGGLIADGYLAVEAQDAQQVRNVARDIRTLAAGLGVAQELVNRGKNIVEFADAGHWETLMETLEALQNEVSKAMEENKDQDLVTLVKLGGWLRGTQVVTAHIAANYNADAAKVLRQPAVVEHFVRTVAAMPKRLLDTPMMDAVRISLFDIRKVVTFSPDVVPKVEDVQKLNELATAIMKTISTK